MSNINVNSIKRIFEVLQTFEEKGKVAIEETSTDYWDDSESYYKNVNPWIDLGGEG